MDTNSLACLEHANMIEAIAMAGSVIAGATVHREGGVAAIGTGLPILTFNQVMVERDDASETAVADAVAIMRARNTAFVVNLRIGPDDRLGGLLRELGLTPLGSGPWMPGMALDPIPEPGAWAAAGLDIRRVTDGRGLEDSAAVAALGFGAPDWLMRAVLPPAALDLPGMAVYVGYADGRPACTAVGVRTGRAIGVYSVATDPAWRRRGFGAAITARIAEDARAGGAEVAVLQASDMGYPVYARMGYRTVIEYTGYVEPDPA